MVSSTTPSPRLRSRVCRCRVPPRRRLSSGIGSAKWPTPAGVEERRAASFRLVDHATAPGCVAAYFPETNVLVPLDSTADESGTPTSKSIVVRLEPQNPRQVPGVSVGLPKPRASAG